MTACRGVFLVAPAVLPPVLCQPVSIGKVQRTVPRPPALLSGRSRVAHLLYSPLLACAAIAQTPPSQTPPQTIPTQAPPTPDPTPQITYPSRNRFLLPYFAPHVPPPNLDNSPRIYSLIRAGSLYLSLADAIALALENNLDIVNERYALPIASTDTLRAKGGGTLRGISLITIDLPPGIGGPASPLLNSAATGSLATVNVPSNLAEINAITPPTPAGIGITGASHPLRRSARAAVRPHADRRTFMAASIAAREQQHRQRRPHTLKPWTDRRPGLSTGL